MSAGRLDLFVDRRTPWWETIDFEAEDLTGAAFLLEVRQTKDTTGTAPISLANSVSPAEGMTLTTETRDGILYSILAIRINEGTLEALPYAGERGGNLVWWWDLHVTPVGGRKEVALSGNFTIYAGVTI